MTMLETRETDREIQKDVIAEIDRDWRFMPAEIGVEVDDGIVTLTGTVSSYMKLLDAAKIAARVASVKDVANKLTVQLAHTDLKDDTVIAKHVRTALEWTPDVPDKKIDSIVRNGVVTLKGTVDYWYEKTAAAAAIRRVGGVVSVINDLTVKPEPRADQEIFDDIRAALGRRMPWASKAIDLTVDKGVVTLIGTATSYSDRRQIEEVAWSAPGVKAVTSRLLVKF